MEFLKISYWYIFCILFAEAIYEKNFNHNIDKLLMLRAKSILYLITIKKSP